MEVIINNRYLKIGILFKKTAARAEKSERYEYSCRDGELGGNIPRALASSFVKRKIYFDFYTVLLNTYGCTNGLKL